MAFTGLVVPSCLTSWLPQEDSTVCDLAVFVAKVVATSLIVYINYWLWILPMNRVSHT